MTDKPAESNEEELREAYDRLAVSTRRRHHSTHHADCGCFTDAADALITTLEAKLAAAERRVQELEKALRLLADGRWNVGQAEAKAAELERMLLIHWQHQHNLVYDTDPADGTSYDDWLADLRERAEQKDRP